MEKIKVKAVLLTFVVVLAILIGASYNDASIKGKILNDKGINSLEKFKMFIFLNGKKIASYDSPDFERAKMVFTVKIKDTIGVEKRHDGSNDPSVSLYAYFNGDWRDSGHFTRVSGNEFNGEYKFVVNGQEPWMDVDPAGGWYFVWEDKNGEFNHVGEGNDIYSSSYDVQGDTIPFENVEVETHAGCSSGYCAAILGPGEDTCNHYEDCRHLVCNHAMRWCEHDWTPGEDECSTNSDCF